jgi:hypothetical protein
MRLVRFLLLISFLFLVSSAHAEVTLVGKVAEVVEESEDFQIQQRHFILELNNSGRLRLVGQDESVFEALLGKRAYIRGEVVNDFDFNVNEIVAAGTVRAEVVSSSVTALKFLVVRLGINGNPVPDVSAASVRELIYEDPTRSTRKLYEANTYGAITIESVDVPDSFSLAIDVPGGTGSCFPFYTGQLLPGAATAVRAMGFEPNNYDRILYLVPLAVGTRCGFAGVAISSRETLYSGNLSSTLIMHETGHNFGFQHASTDDNNDGTLEDAYGDPSCAMSLSGIFYNLVHQVKRNWFNAAGGFTQTYSGTTPRLFTMAPSELWPTNTTLPQLIRIDVPSVSRPYYVTFRKRTGLFDDMRNVDSLSNRKLYILREPTDPLLRNTLLVGTVETGGRITFPSDNLTIELLSETNNVANVRFWFGDTDSDSDGTLDSIDADDDNDGVSDALDCAPSNPGYWTHQGYQDRDADGVGDSAYLTFSRCLGSVPEEGYTLNGSPTDNCYGIANPDQADSDGDGIGNACDTSPTPTATSTPTPTPTNGNGNGNTGNPGEPRLVSFKINSSSINARKWSVINQAKFDVAYGYVTCSVQTPSKRAYSRWSAAKLLRYTGLTQTFECGGSSSKKGVYKVKVKACDIYNRCRTLTKNLTRKR